MATMTVSTQGGGTRDRRCVFSEPLQQACLIDNIKLPSDGKLSVTARIHAAPSYSLPPPPQHDIPDVTGIRNFDIDTGALVAQASLAFSMVTDLAAWGPCSLSSLFPSSSSSPKDKTQTSKTRKRQLQLKNVQLHMQNFQSSYSCDESLSCHYQNIVLSDLNHHHHHDHHHHNNRATTDHEEQVIWLYGGNNTTLEKETKHKQKVVTPCTHIPVTTTLHKRFVTSIGWRQGERPAIMMKSANEDSIHTSEDNKHAMRALQRTAQHCIASPSILFTIPFPSYYYHAIVEGAVPLANAIQRGYNGRRDVQLVNVQRWGDVNVLPVFLQDILAALSDLTPVTLEQLQVHAHLHNTNANTKSLCFQEMSTGFWPTLRTRKDFTQATEMLQKYILSPTTKLVYPRPPTPWQLGMLQQTNVPRGLPILVIVQRTVVDNLNFDGQEKTANKVQPTRVIRNIDALSKIGHDLGFETKIVDLAGMTLRAQVELMQTADVFAAVFGSAWANVVWMRRKGTTAIMLLGWGFKDGCDFQMPSSTPVRLLSNMCQRPKTTTFVNSTGGNQTGVRSRGTKFFYNDHCDAVLHEFPALVDPSNSYVEIVAKRPEQFDAPFLLDTWICQHDKERFNTDYGTQTAENIARCMQDQFHAHNRAIANPSWAWEHAGINAAHLFFLNANLWVDTEDFELALVGALPKITRLSELKKTTATAGSGTGTTAVATNQLVKTCWISIDPNSDSLVASLTRSALLMLPAKKQITAQVVGAKIRFAVRSSGHADDIKLELQLKCTGEGGQTFFIGGILTLMSNKQGLPFWFPVSVESTEEMSLWKDQRFAPSWSSNGCALHSGDGLVGAIRHMLKVSTFTYKQPLRRLMVRLEKISQETGAGSRTQSNNTAAFAASSSSSSSSTSALWPVERKNVVVGVAVNYGMDEFRRFVGSLRATGFSGTIVLGVSANILPECTRYLTRHHVEIRIVKKGDLTPAKQKGDGGHSDFYNIALPRWMLYQEWIDESIFSNTTRFLLTDTRDVYFQRAPFDDLKYDQSHELYMFEEWGQKTVGNCKHNSDWVRSCWGSSILEQLAQHPIICSGTIIGSRKGITLLVSALVMEAAHVKTLQHEVDGKAQHGRPCVNDQAYVNVLMRQQFEKKGEAVEQGEGEQNLAGTMATLKSLTKIFAQGDGPVNTVGWLAVNGLISRDVDGFVLNNDGRKSAVVHQYDRDLDLQNWLDAKFVHVLDPLHEEWVAGRKYADDIRTALGA